MLGLYLRPERTGMNYNDVHAVEGQLAELKQEVLNTKTIRLCCCGALATSWISSTPTPGFGMPWRSWPSSFMTSTQSPYVHGACRNRPGKGAHG